MAGLKRIGAVLTLVSVLTLPLTALAINDVTGVEATAGDSEVTLEWDPVADAEFYRIYTGTEPVSAEEAYNLPTIDTPTSSTTYTVEELTNGTTYYFSVTAVMEDDESVNYSNEASATPQVDGSADASEFTVVSANATNNETIVITFSKAITLPANAAQAFQVTYNFDESPLSVSKVELVAGSEEKQVRLTTVPQEPGGEYTVTIPSTLTDKEDNTLSASNQVVIFLGSEVLPGTVQAAGDDEENVVGNTEATTGVTIESVEATSGTEIVVTFSDAVLLAGGASEPFSIINNNQPDQYLTIQNVTLDSDDPTRVVITTEQQTATTYTLVVGGVTDAEGNLLAADDSIIEFVSAAGAGDGDDSNAPEDVTDFKAMLEDAAKLLVALTWTKSVDSANDLVEYVLYQSADGGVTFQQIKTVEAIADAKALIDNLQANQTYTFKLTAKDAEGNESEGVTTVLTLPETGPGLGLLAMSSLFGGRYLARRRRK